MRTPLTINNLSSWLDNSNFRITTSYIFELLNVTDQNFYMLWCVGAGNSVSVKVSTQPDVISEALQFDIDNFPNGNIDSNYRFNKFGIFQLYNVDTELWHSIYIVKSGNEAPSLKAYTQGEL